MMRCGLFFAIGLLSLLSIRSVAQEGKRHDLDWPTPRPMRTYVVGEVHRGSLSSHLATLPATTSLTLGVHLFRPLRLDMRLLATDGYLSRRGEAQVAYYVGCFTVAARMDTPPIMDRERPFMGFFYPFFLMSVGGGLRTGTVQNVPVRDMTIHASFRAGWRLTGWLDFSFGYEFYLTPHPPTPGAAYNHNLSAGFAVHWSKGQSR